MDGHPEAQVHDLGAGEEELVHVARVLEREVGERRKGLAPDFRWLLEQVLGQAGVDVNIDDSLRKPGSELFATANFSSAEAI